MKPVKWLSSVVVEAGIKYIIKNLPPGSKKVILPLRLAVSFCLTFLFFFLYLFFMHANFKLIAKTFH